jgi:hypothetical protein
MASSDIKIELTADAQKALADLDDTFSNKSLPDGLDLAITDGHGTSIGIAFRRWPSPTGRDSHHARGRDRARPWTVPPGANQKRDMLTLIGVKRVV